MHDPFGDLLDDAEEVYDLAQLDDYRRKRRAALSRGARREVLAEEGLDRPPTPPKRALATGGQGTGKSRVVAETIAELKTPIAWWWLCPTVQKCVEQAREYEKLRTPGSPPVVVVRGRGAPDPDTPDEAMCPRHLVVNRAAAMGVDVERDICRECPQRTECGFQKQRQALDDQSTGLFLMSHEYAWLPCPAPTADVVIIDESLIGRAADVVSFDPSRITEHDKWAKFGDPEGEKERHRIAALVRTALVEHAGAELAFLRSQVGKADLQACAQHLRSRDEAKPVVSGAMSDKQISVALDAVRQRETSRVYRLFRQLVREFEKPRRGLNSIWFDPDCMVNINGNNERQPRVFVSYIRQHRFGKTKPILALDGTGSITLHRAVFGESMEHHEFKAPRDALVVQVVGKSFSRQSITGVNKKGGAISAKSLAESAALRGQIIEVVKFIKEETLLVTYKAAADMLAPHVPPHVQVAHFGAIRGLNCFENCKTVVVVGREQPPVATIEALARPFTADDDEQFRPADEWVQQSRGRRLREPADNVVSVAVHPHPTCTEMLEQVREAEAVQAVDRARCVYNRRRIILLTDLPLDVTVDRTLTWAQARVNVFMHIFARYGVLPLSGRDLHRRFPRVWANVWIAEKALVRSELNTDTFPIDNLLGKCPHYSPATQRATYRRRGQRGKPAKAVLLKGLPDPRAALEALVGPVTDFALDVIEMPDESAGATTPEPGMSMGTGD